MLTTWIATSLFAQSSGPTMKAIVVHQFGGPEVLKLEVVPRPEPKEDEILVKVIAAGVNSFDGGLRSGTWAKIFKINLPWIPGYDIAGTVEKVGGKVTKFKAGDPVYALISLLGGGGDAEYAIAKEDQAAPKPATISFTEAAAVPSVALTAWQALVDKADIQSGQTVLIHGATGGMGISALQICKARGIRVIGSGGTEKGRKLLLEEGADFVVDHKDPGHLDQVLKLTDGHGVDVILENLANVNLGGDLKALAPHGRVLVVGSRGKVEIDPRDTMN